VRVERTIDGDGGAEGVAGDGNAALRILHISRACGRGCTVVTLLLPCCYTVVTLLLHCCHTLVTLLCSQNQKAEKLIHVVTVGANTLDVGDEKG
jgi:hypothetical protein